MKCKRKAKNIFTIKEEIEIKRLLLKLREASKANQKIIRGNLRKKLNFYISRFTSSKKGFTLDDFQDLKMKGIIKII